MKQMRLSVLAWSGFCAVCLSLCAAISLAQATGPVVSEVKLLNARLLSAAEVLEALGVQEGAPLDVGELERAVQRWNEDATRGTISYRLTPRSDGTVELTLDVAEQFVLTSLTFVGNRHFSADFLSREVGWAIGQPIGPRDVAAKEAELTALYNQAGFYLACAKAALGARPGEIVFFISEGPRTHVAEVVFEGNAQVSEDELLSFIKTGKRRWPAFLWPGRFDEEIFREDALKVQEALRARGFLDAEVAGHMEFTDDMTGLVLHFFVYEGPLYRIKEISVEGNRIFRAQELLAATRLAVGEPFRPADVEAAARQIAELYAAQGYVDVTAEKGNLLIEPVFPLEGSDVAVKIKIREGEPVFIRRIQIVNLTKTKESVVRRHLTFYPGERADAGKLAESERILANTGYFDPEARRPVQITLEPDEGALRDAVVQVQEGPTGWLMLGGGIGTDSGLLGQVSVVERNFDISNLPESWDDLWRGNAFRGGGQSLSIILRAGTKRSYYSLSFEDPSAWGTPYSLGGNLYSRSIARNEFDERRTGLAVTGGENITPFVRHELTLGYEGINVTNVSATSPVVARDAGTHSKGFARYAVTLDRRDNRFSPSEGYALMGSAECAAGDVQTVRLDAEAQKYWTVREVRDWGKHVVGVRGHLAVVTSYGGSVPVFERLYAGGIGTLRGFSYEGVSPVDRVTGDQIGGNSMAVGSVEYSLPIAPQDRFRLAGFFDFGWVSEGVGGVLKGLSDLRAAVGVGLRVKVPFLGPMPIQVDLAVPVVSQDGDRTQNLHFSIGAERRF